MVTSAYDTIIYHGDDYNQLRLIQTCFSADNDSKLWPLH